LKPATAKPEAGDGVEVDGVIKPPVCDGTGGLLKKEQNILNA